jgi:hypothetical protein
MINEALFFCERRSMPVAKDTTDCLGCPLRFWPTPCQQYDYFSKLAKQQSLGYNLEPERPSDLTE